MLAQVRVFEGDRVLVGRSHGVAPSFVRWVLG
jgi:hypothetical protein